MQLPSDELTHGRRVFFGGFGICRNFPAYAPEDGSGGGDGGEGNGNNSNTGVDGAGDDGSGGAGGDKAQEGGTNDKARSLIDRFARSDDKSGTDAGDKDGSDSGDKAAKGERPEYVAGKFWDAEKGEIRHEAMAKAYQTLEAAHNRLKADKGFKAPASADDYFKDPIELPKEVDRIGIDGQDDPGLKAWGKVAHKWNLPSDMVRGIVKDMFVEMNGHMPEPVDPDAEFAKLGKNGKNLVTSLDLWMNGLENGGEFSADEIEYLHDAFGQSAVGITALTKLRNMTGEEPIPLNGADLGRGMSQTEWQAEFNKALDKGDVPRQMELEKIGEEIFGNDPGRSSNLPRTMRR